MLVNKMKALPFLASFQPDSQELLVMLLKISNYIQSRLFNFSFFFNSPPKETVMNTNKILMIYKSVSI